MSLELPAETTQYVEGLVAEGHFDSKEAAVTEAVRLLKLERLRVEVKKGIDQLEAGLGRAGPTVLAEIREKIQHKCAE